MIKWLSTAALLLAGVTSLAQAQQASPTLPSAVLEIPKLSQVAFDGKPGDWGQQGFRIDALSSNQPQAIPAGDFDAQVRLAWDDQGLRILLTVHDNQWVEADADSEMYKADSVELFLRPDIQSTRNVFQVLIGPGMAPGHENVRTYIHDYREGALRDIHAQVRVARTPLPGGGGYTMEVCLPLEVVGLKPAAGTLVPLALTINDADGRGRSGSYVRWGWEKPGWNFHLLKLGTQAATPTRLGAAGSYQRLRRSIVFLNATAELAGKKAVVRRAGSVLAQGVIPRPAEGERLTHLRLAYPMPQNGQPWDGVVLQVEGESDLPVDFIDPQGWREQTARELKVQVSEAVFAGDTLPAITLADPSLAEDALGPYSTQVRYFDAAYHQVKSAGGPGRYGAIFEVQGEDGKVKLTRSVPLFRKPADAGADANARQTMAELLGREGGLSAGQIAAQQATLVRELGRVATEATASSTHLAQVLAAVWENTDVSPVRVRAQDDRWWHGLQKSLGLVAPLESLEFLPKGYDPKGQKKWPLIIFLHGSGDFNLARLAHDGVKRIADSQPDQFGFVVVQPSCPDFRWWSAPELDDMLDEVLRTHDVDPDRIYLTGFSMGGYATWEWAIDHPDRFAAIAPVAGVGDAQYAPRVAKIPVFFIQSAVDEAVPLAKARPMFDALTKSGVTVKELIFKDSNHTMTSRLAYENPELYTWFLQHRKSQNK